MVTWIRDAEPLEPIRCSFRADPHRDQAVHQALSKLPFRAGGAFARYAVAQALAAGLVNVDDFMQGKAGSPAAQRAPRSARSAARAPASAVSPVAAVAVNAASPTVKAEVQGERPPASDAELEALRTTARF